ncbi:hypothetical protein MRX96_056518 [Rhipicephalus microplus]
MGLFLGAWHGPAVTSTASAVDIGTTSRQFLFSGSGGGMGVRSLQASLLDFTGGRSYQQMQFVVVRCARAPITVSDSWAVYASTAPAFQAFNLSSAFITGTGNGLEWDCFYGAWHGAAVTSTASAVDIRTTSRQLLFSGSGGGMASDRYKLVCLILQVAAVTSRCSPSSSDVRVLPSQFPDSWAVYASTDPAFQAFNLSSAFITGTGNGLEWDCFYGAWHGAAVKSTASAAGYRNDIPTVPLQWVRRRHGVRSLQASLLDFTGGRSYQQMQSVVVRCERAPIIVSRFLGRVRLDRSCISSFQFIIGVYHGHR